MPVVNPSTAVIAKAKSKYGKKLTTKDYAALVKCDTVADVMRYLKGTPAYSKSLSKVSSNIHRGNLENILRERLVDDFLSLCRYNRSNSPVSGYLFRRAEIRELVKYLTLLSTGRPLEYIFTLPMYLDEHTEIPLRLLSSAHNYQELTELIDMRGYKEILQRYEPSGEDEINISAIEEAFEVFSYQELYNDISKLKSKSEKTALKKLFDDLVDIYNFSRLVRLKKYYNMSGDEIKEHLLPFGSFTGRKLDTLLKYDSFEEYYKALRATRTGKAIDRTGEDMDQAAAARYSDSRREMYFSSSPEVVLLAYYIVSETELKNIITVIEGVRYSMTPESIYSMLIL